MSSIFSTNAFANPPCKGIEVPFEGEIHTTNIIDEGGLTGTQNGSIIINNEHGVIAGIITNQTGVRTTLNHMISIEDLGLYLMTLGDIALARQPALETFNGVGCKFHVFEAITNITGMHEGQDVLNGTAFAEGTINLCPGSGLMNDFIITGTLCTTSP